MQSWLEEEWWRKHAHWFCWLRPLRPNKLLQLAVWSSPHLLRVNEKIGPAAPHLFHWRKEGKIRLAAAHCHHLTYTGKIRLMWTWRRSAAIWNPASIVEYAKPKQPPSRTKLIEIPNDKADFAKCLQEHKCIYYCTSPRGRSFISGETTEKISLLTIYLTSVIQKKAIGHYLSC